MRSGFRRLAGRAKDINRKPPRWLSYTIGIGVSLFVFILVKLLLGAYTY